MNKINKRYSAALFAVMVAFAPALYPMDNQTEVIIEQESTSSESVVWYKKESTQKIASGLVVAAVVGYAIAVHMDKVSSPFALFTALFCSQAAKNSVAAQSAHEPAQENKSTQDKAPAKTQDHHNKPTPTEPVQPNQPENKHAEQPKTATHSSQTEEHHKQSKIEKSVEQENQQTVQVDQNLGLPNTTHNFVGQKGIQVPQILKNVWQALKQRRSDEDLVSVI